MQHLHKRRGYWYYIRRVPDRARPVDPRKWINKTTGIRIADDPHGISAGARAAQQVFYVPALTKNRSPG